MTETQLLLWLISVVFGCLGAIMGYIITYSEYTRHFPDKRKVRKMAMQTAGVVFFLFAGLGAVLALILPQLMK
ncbi:MAG: hypothetical protein GXO69_05025 [Acidobacteria bacterium]|nr:hypothetical protein [Acidobacteriota bacterium]